MTLALRLDYLNLLPAWMPAFLRYALNALLCATRSSQCPVLLEPLRLRGA